MEIREFHLILAHARARKMHTDFICAILREKTFSKTTMSTMGATKPKTEEKMMAHSTVTMLKITNEEKNTSWWVRVDFQVTTITTTTAAVVIASRHNS